MSGKAIESNQELFFLCCLCNRKTPEVTESVILTKTKASQVIYFPKKNNSAAQNILVKCMFISSLPPAQQVLEFMNNCCHDVLTLHSYGSGRF